MKRIARLVACTAVLAVTAAFPVAGSGAATGHHPQRPTRVLIVLFDQMVPKYANQFDMPNFRRLRNGGTFFKNAYLGYMASETVISHNVIMSGQLPKHMGWTDEAYRDAGNELGNGADAMYITGDLSLDNFGTLVNGEGYPKLADYLHAAQPGSKFIVVGEKSYAVESAAASTADIAVRLSSRSSSSLFDDCRTELGGRYRFPAGKDVPAYLSKFCGRWYINSDGGNDYGTTAAFPSFMYPEDGNRFFPGTDASAQAGHVGGDTWVADAAIRMMKREAWSGMFVTLGAIDKAGHMWGAQADAADFTGPCHTGDPVADGAAQTHVRCAAENADAQLGRLMRTVKALDEADGGKTLVVLTADHGATYGKHFYGNPTADAGDTNWYYAPTGVWDAGEFLPPGDPTYYNPSPALQPLIDTGNIQFSYQSTAIEAWLIDHSVPRMKQGAAAMLQTPGVIASYWHDGDRFRLYGTNHMTQGESAWWTTHAQRIVNAMASSNGPDVIGLLHNKTSYGVYGDHGGAQESVQRIPIVFWEPGGGCGTSDGPFRTPDIMPTILRLMGIPQTASTDGTARALGGCH
jgi:Type I phosphodiesterase / nucleotide pyrophosphatase